MHINLRFIPFCRCNLACAGYAFGVAWGKCEFGQCDVPDDLSDVVQIAAGGTHSLALKSDGTVVAWGNNDYGQCDVPDGLSDVVQNDLAPCPAVPGLFAVVDE